MVPYGARTLNQHTVTDIFEFVNEVRELKINEGYILVSYDVSSLFTNVPLDETTHLVVFVEINLLELGYKKEIATIFRK